MGILFNHDLVGIGLQFLNELYGGTVLDQRVWFAEEGEFGVVFRSNGLNMDDLSIGFTETVQERSNVLNDRLESRAMSLAAFSLHIDNDQARVFRGKLDCSSFVHDTSDLVEVLVLLTKPDSPRQVSLIEIFLGGFRNFDLF